MSRYVVQHHILHLSSEKCQVFLDSTESSMNDVKVVNHQISDGRVTYALDN